MAKEYYKLTNNSWCNSYEGNFKSASEVVEAIKKCPEVFATGYDVERVHIGNGIDIRHTIVYCDNRSRNPWSVVFPRSTNTPKAFYELVNLSHPLLPEIDECEKIKEEKKTTVGELLDMCYRVNKITLSKDGGDLDELCVAYDTYLTSNNVIPRRVREASVSCYFIGGDNLLIYYKE